MRAASLLTLFIFLQGSLAIGAVKTLVHDAHNLVRPEFESAVRVKTARVVIADYARIRADFQVTFHMSEDEIDSWILDQAAYIAVPHALSDSVNTPVTIQRGHEGRPVEKLGARPQLYGRALVFSADHGLIDVKGAGSLKPSLMSHRTGLATLGEMLREYLFQKMTQRIFDHSGSGLQTVDSYAVVDWGFDTYDLDGKPLRAGAILRQAQARPEILHNYEANHFADHITTRIVEDVLRHYGMTSTGDGANDSRELANVQVTTNGETVDFGAFLVSAHFSKKVAHYGTEGFISSPAQSSFVQPDPRLALPLAIWGSTETNRQNPRFDNAWVWSHRLAADLASGRATLSDVQNHLRTFLEAGAFPPSLHGLYADETSNEHKAFIAKELLRVGSEQTHFINTQVLEAYLRMDERYVAGSFLSSLLTKENLQHSTGVYFEILAKQNVFKKFPALLAQMAVNGKWVRKDVLDALFETRRLDLISELLTENIFYSEEAIEFFSEPSVKKEPEWINWVLLAMRRSDAFARAFLSQVPEASQHAEFINYFYSTKDRPQHFIAVLEARHWRTHPELVDHILKLIEEEHGGTFWRVKLSRALIDGETWRDHPRYAIWNERILSESRRSCRATF